MTACRHCCEIVFYTRSRLMGNGGLKLPLQLPGLRISELTHSAGPDLQPKFPDAQLIAMQVAYEQAAMSNFAVGSLGLAAIGHEARIKYLENAVLQDKDVSS